VVSDRLHISFTSVVYRFDSIGGFTARPGYVTLIWSYTVSSRSQLSLSVSGLDLFGVSASATILVTNTNPIVVSSLDVMNLYVAQ
jgi:hypothetical protein